MVGSKRDVLKNKSLIYVTKSSGPSIEPWGTPHFYFKIFTFNILFPVCEVTFKPIQIVSLNITELKSFIKISWSAVPNAFDKSTNIPIVSFLSLNESKILSTSSNNA